MFTKASFEEEKVGSNSSEAHESKEMIEMIDDKVKREKLGIKCVVTVSCSNDS